MALITKTVPVSAGALAPFVATAVGGDTVAFGGGDLVIEFHNTHASSITVNIAPVATNVIVAGVGPMTPPTRTLAIAASAHGAFRFKRDEISAYLNSNGLLSITYTSGNVLLLVRAIEIP